MYPVILAAFAALGVGRLTLLALQLSAEVNNQSAEDEGHASRSSSSSSSSGGGGNGEEEGIEGGYQQPLSPRTSQEEEDRALRAVVAGMARLEKPVKMLQRGDFHYLCIWREADFHPQMSEADLVRAAVSREERVREGGRERGALAREDSGSGFQQELFRTLQDMTAFFDQLVVGKALEPLLLPPSSLRGEMGEGRGGQTRRHVATGEGWLQLQEQEQREEQEEDEEGEEQESGFWSWLIGSKPASSSGGLGSAHPDSTVAAPSDSSSVCSTSNAAAATGCGGENGEEHGVCLVCCEREQDTVLLSCGHGGTCFKCACDVYRRSGECPLCRARVDQIVQIGRRRQHLPNGLDVVPVTGPWPTSASCW